MFWRNRQASACLQYSSVDAASTPCLIRKFMKFSFLASQGRSKWIIPHSQTKPSSLSNACLQLHWASQHVCEWVVEIINMQRNQISCFAMAGSAVLAWLNYQSHYVHNDLVQHILLLELQCNTRSWNFDSLSFVQIISKWWYYKLYALYFE